MRGTDFTGKKVGCLTPVSCYTSPKTFRRVWVCKCDCGKETHVEARNLKRYPDKKCEHSPQLDLPLDGRTQV